MKSFKEYIKETHHKKYKNPTFVNDGHSHDYNIDDNGNGMTTKTIGNDAAYKHEIKTFKVLPSEGHKHTLIEK